MKMDKIRKMSSIEERLKALEIQNKELRADLEGIKKKGVLKKDRKKKAPSAYNIFVKEAMPHLKEQFPDLSHKELFKLAAQEWSKKKASAVEENNNE